MRTLFLGLILLFATQAQAADYTTVIQTPRGTTIKLDFYNFGTVKHVLFIAPEQGCAPRLDLYDEVARASKPKNVMLVRLHWAYCVTAPELGEPSDGLVEEEEDVRTALSFLVQWLNITEKDIVLGGKSLGTVLALRVFKGRPDLKGLLLMTPVCTGHGRNMFDIYYPDLKSIRRPVALIKGDADLSCRTEHWNEYLSERGQNFSSKLVKGDHNYFVYGADGKVDAEQTRRNLETIGEWLSSAF